MQLNNLVQANIWLPAHPDTLADVLIWLFSQSEYHIPGTDGWLAALRIGPNNWVQGRIWDTPSGRRNLPLMPWREGTEMARCGFYDIRPIKAWGIRGGWYTQAFLDALCRKTDLPAGAPEGVAPLLDEIRVQGPIDLTSTNGRPVGPTMNPKPILPSA
jgi:hypothetical protein